MALNCSKATRLLLFLSAISCLIERSYAITCLCDDCPIHSECQEEGLGAACYSRVSVDEDGNVHRQKRCYNAVYAQRQCKLRTSIAVIECCYEDYCNKDLEPQLPSNNTTPETVVVTDPVVHNNSILNPHETTEETPTLDIGPIFEVPLLCHRHHTKKSNNLISHCTVPVGGGCYHLTRRSPNGTIEFERFGCAEKCIDEDRNRAVKRCCNTSWCNTPPTKPPSLSEPSSHSSTTASSTTKSTTLSNTRSVPTSESSILAILLLPSVSISKASVSTIEQDSQATLAYPMTTSTGHSTQPMFTPSSTLHTSLATLKGTSHPESSATLDESSVIIYIAGSIILAIMSIIIIVVIVVCFVTYYKYKTELNQEKENENESSKGSVENSTDTLVHGETVV